MTTQQANKVIEILSTIAEQAIALADEYAGGESETAAHLADELERIMQTYDKLTAKPTN